MLQMLSFDYNFMALIERVAKLPSEAGLSTPKLNCHHDSAWSSFYENLSGQQ